MIRAAVIAVLAALAAPATSSVFEARTFATPEHEARYVDLVAELRCLVCQNQNLRDSDAELASDLRREVHEMIEAGQTDAEIVDFMVERYGEFVLYRPRLSASTVLLWGGPFVLALGSLLALGVAIRRRARVAAPAEPPDRSRAASLLRGDDAG